MATIYTRAAKGSALTWTEGDANITNLNNAKIENVVEDTTPQLGGNLDVNGNSIISVSNGNIAITPNGTGSVVLDGLNWPQADGTNGQVLTTNGSGQLSFSTVTGGATNLDGLSDVVITSPVSGHVLRHNGTNFVNVAETTLSVSSATTATTATGATNINISTTNGNGSDSTLYPVLVGANSTGNQLPHIDSGAFSYDASTDTLNIGTSGVTSGKIFLESSGGGDVSIQAGATATSTTFIFPVTTGTTQQLLTTNGSGQASWTSSLTGGFTFNSTTANTQKLTIGPASLSSTAWTTNGVGLRIQAAQYTDTSSTGTVANSHVHAIGASILASSNTITVTDAGSLYIAGPPTAGSNTTITNGWALLANGAIKATSFTGSGAGLTSIPNSGLTNSAITFGATSQALGSTVSALNSVAIGSTTASTGAFTTLSASSTVSGTGFSNYLASPPAIGGTAAAAITGTTITANTRFVGAHDGTVGATTPNTGAFTTVSASTTTTSGAINATYNPSTATGAAIQTSGGITQGGAGFFDFLKPTNTTAGATNANKSFRLNSTGALEIVNSAYSSTILSLTDAGALTVGGTTFPTTTGTNGQVLTANGSGGSSWTTVSGGSGPSFALVYLSTADFAVSNTASNSNLFGVATLVEDYDANNIISINGDNDIVIAAAGTYIYEILSVSLFATNYGPGTASTALTSATAFFNIYNITTATQIASQDLNTLRHPGNGSSITYRGNLGAVQIKTKIVTTTANNIIRVRVTGQSSSSGGSEMTFAGNRPITIKITKLA